MAVLDLDQAPLRFAISRFSFDDYLSDTTTDNQTVPIYDRTGGNNLSNDEIVILRAGFYIYKAWAGGTVTGTIGGSDADGLVTQFTNTAEQNDLSPGANANLALTVTTAGANTGTAGAGLSLIGDTTAVNQASNLMNDLAALREDIATLDTRTTNMFTQYQNGQGSGGESINATLGTDTAWSSLTAGEGAAWILFLDVRRYFDSGQL